MKQRRVLHHVDGKRDHRAGPRLRLAAHQAHRHREAVVDIHLVDDGEIEIVLDHRLRDVARQLRMADQLGHRARAPALVGDREFGRGADRKGRDDIEAEGVGVIVVDQENDVRLLVLHPLLGEFVTAEDLLPVGLAGLAEVERRAHGRNMRGINARGNMGHHFFSPV
jgi:hypothetical protein